MKLPEGVRVPDARTGGHEEAPVQKSLSREILDALELLPTAGWSAVQRRVEFKDHQNHMTARVVDGFKTSVQFLKKDYAPFVGRGDFKPVVLKNGALLNNTMVLPAAMIDSQFEVILERVTPVAPESTQFLSPYRLRVAIPKRGSLYGTVQVEEDGRYMAESLWEVLERKISEPSETIERGEGSLAVNALAEALDPNPSLK